MTDTGKVIYGDGTQEVTVTGDVVILEELAEDGETISEVKFSRAAFRELVLGWQRLLAQEQERP